MPATEISGVSVIPPEGFTGQMLVTAELRDGNGVALTGTVDPKVLFDDYHYFSSFSTTMLGGLRLPGRFNVAPL